MPVSTRPLSPVFGAEVIGVDIENGLTDEVFQDIVDLWRKHLVLLIRGQAVGDERLLKFARRFGSLDPAPQLDKNFAAHRTAIPKSPWSRMSSKTALRSAALAMESSPGIRT